MACKGTDLEAKHDVLIDWQLASEDSFQVLLNLQQP